MEHDKSVQRYSMLVIIMSSFLTAFLSGAINIAIPSIGEQFRSGALLLGWVVTGFLLGSAVFLVPAGRVADIIGRRKVFLTGLAIFSIAACLCGTSGSIMTLIVFQCIQGASAAMIFSTAPAILSSVFPPQRRGRVLGLNAACVYAGFSLGPVLGGIINHRLGWSAIYYLCAGVGLLVTLAGFFKLKGNWENAAHEKYDWIGTLLYMPGLVALMYGITTAASSGYAKYLMTGGAALLVVFIVYEKKASYPILDIRLFSKNRVFAFSSLAVFLNYSAIAGMSFLLSVYLQVARGYDSQTAGLILIFQPVVIVALAPFSGRLSDRLNPQIMASCGMGLCALGIGAFCFLSADTPLWFITGTLVIMGAGMALFAAPNTNAAMGSVEKQNYGIASSIIGTMRMTGQAVSLTLVTLIINVFVGNAELSAAGAAQLIMGCKTACGVLAAIGLGGIFSSLIRNKRDKRHGAGVI